MLNIRRILCPVDFSEASRHAFDHAKAIAGWYGSRITALHVFSPVPLPGQSLVFGGIPALTPVTAGDRQVVEDELRAWVASSGGGSIADCLVVGGFNHAAEILERVGTLSVDLIVMGTHGRSGFDRLVVGSVTEKVLRKAGCPVLAVPPPVVRPTKPPYKRVICPIDFSPASIAALGFACSVVKESDAQLTLVHVFESPVDQDSGVDQFDAPEFSQERVEKARQRLEALMTDEVRTWARLQTDVSYGKPYQRILAAAEKADADLIVMGVYGRNPIDMLLMGSTTNHVVRMARSAVLTLKQ